MGMRAWPTAVLVLTLALVASCSATPSSCTGSRSAPSALAGTAPQVLQRGIVGGRTWVLETVSPAHDGSGAADCLTVSWVDEPTVAATCVVGARLEDQAEGDFPLPDGRWLRLGVVSPSATQVRVHGRARTTYAATHPVPHRDSAIRSYVVPVDDEFTLVEPIDSTGNPAPPARLSDGSRPSPPAGRSARPSAGAC
jgi:hypothetical protein